MHRMRRTGKKEEVNKCSFEHTCRTPPWRVAGMTEMTRAVGLSYGADKRKRARASPWNYTGEVSPGSLLLLQCGMAVWEVGSGKAHYPTLAWAKLPNVPCDLGEVHAQWRAVCAPKGSQLPLLLSEGSQTGFALWCQDAAQRMCIYFSKLRELTQQIVPAQEEKVKHSDLISTKKPHPSCRKVSKKQL